ATQLDVVEREPEGADDGFHGSHDRLDVHDPPAFQRRSPAPWWQEKTWACAHVSYGPLGTGGSRLPTEPDEYTRPRRRFPVDKPREPGGARSAVVEPAEGLLAGLLDVDRADAVVEFREVGVDLGVGVVRVPGDRPGQAILLVEAGHQLGDRRVAERRVVLEHVAELAGELADRRSGIVVRHRRS